MRRLPLAAFLALVVATIAAVFITQHLKVTTPLIAGAFGPTPPAIHPGAGGCASATTINFSLLHAADEINVYVVNGADRVVRTLATGVSAGRKQPLQFSWNGHLANGGLAPPARYRFRVRLIHQQRTIDPLINQTTETPMTVRLMAAC